MKMYDVIIIGGGAAGLTAALSASMGGAQTLILEAAPRIGRKLLATGNGRCNMANTGAPRYYGGKTFAQAVLARCAPEQVRQFFAGLGLVTVEEVGGRVYPACGQAAAVLDVLRAAFARYHVDIQCDAPVQALRPSGDAFRLRTPQGEFSARRVIAACGGRAGGKLGHDGEAYALLTALGHPLRPVFPALTQLITEKEAVRGLSGLRLPARLTLCDGRQPYSAAQGEALFTDYGVSGVCAMQLSRDAGALLRRGRKPVLYLDFSPMLGLIPRLYDRVAAETPEKNVPLLQAYLERRAHTLPPDMLLCGLTPRLLTEKLKSLPLREVARMLAAYPAPIMGVKGFENAQVTGGGLDVAAFSPETLSSRLINGLYAVGEMLNVDGDCGGYNLQFAFACGILAGKSAAESLRPSGAGASF